MKATQSTKSAPSSSRDSGASPLLPEPGRARSKPATALMVAWAGLVGAVLSLPAAADDGLSKTCPPTHDIRALERLAPLRADEAGASSPSERFFLLDKAASQGRQEAYWPLAAAYYHGHGVSIDYGRAGEWLERAVQVGKDLDVDHEGVMDASQAAALLDALQTRNSGTSPAGSES